MSDDLFVFIPRDITIPPIAVEWPRMRLDMLQGFGAGVVKHDRVVRIVDPPPMPKAPGVSAMLLDGWQWIRDRFERDGRGKVDLYAKTVVEVQHPITDLDAPVYVGRDGRFRADDDGESFVLRLMTWCATSWSSNGTLMAMVCTKKPRAPGRYAGIIDAGRVLSGRYADRLPTNRARKRERAKARRRARLRGRVAP